MDEQPGEHLRVDVCEGKYTYIKLSSSRVSALRYGEMWIERMPDVGSNMVFALADELDEARKEIAKLKEART